MARIGARRATLPLVTLVVMAASLAGPALAAARATAPALRAHLTLDDGGLVAPVLVSPVDVTAADVRVDLSWLRVVGAAGYHVQVRITDAAGTLLADDRTVNDGIEEIVNVKGAPVWWSVAAVDAGGNEGPAGTATFTSARIAPTLEYPADGAVLSYPNQSTTLRWQSVLGDGYEVLYTDQRVGDVDRPDSAGDGSSMRFGPGQWRWQVGALALPPAGQPTPPLSELRHFSIEWPGSTPQLTTPGDAAHVPAGTNVHLAWAEVAGAEGYEVQYALQGSLPAPQPLVPGIRNAWVDTGSHLIPGVWEWRVRANMAQGGPGPNIAGAWSDVRTFVIDPRPALATLLPADGATLTDWPTLTWPMADAVDYYELQVSDHEDDLAPLVEQWVPAFSFGAPSLTGGFFASVPGLATRHWRVRAVDFAFGNVIATGWSAWRSFTVDPANGTLHVPTVATPSGPADCLDAATCPTLGGVPILRWQGVPGAAFYRVLTSWDGTAENVNSYDVASNSMVVPAYFQPTPGSWTGWEAVACPSLDACDATVTAMLATPRHFRVRVPAPSLVSPADGSTFAASGLRMTWAGIPAPSDPDVVLPPMAGSATIHVMIGADEDIATSMQAYQTNVSASIQGVADGAVVSFHVQGAVAAPANNAYHLTTEASADRSVTRQATVPTILGPADGATVSSLPHFSWTAPAYTVEGYSVQIRSGADVQGVGWTQGTGINRTTWANGQSMELNSPLPAGDYTWRVVPYNGDQFGGTAHWTVGHFTVGGPTELTLVGPAAGASLPANDVDLSWAPLAGAGSYTVAVSPTPTFDYFTNLYNGGGYGTTHQVAVDLPEGDLFWRVCASQVNAAALSCSQTAALSVGTSEVRTLHILAATGPSDTTAPATAGLKIAPSLSSTLTTSGGLSVAATWTASDVGTGIRDQVLEVSRDGGADVPTALAAGVRSASIILTMNHLYRIRVRASDLNGNVGAWSTVTLRTALAQDTSTAWRWSSSWRTSLSSSASGGSTHLASIRGATATATVYARTIALIAPRSSTRGSAEIWVDGIRVATIRLNAVPLGARRIVFTRSWATAGTHRITVRVLGTSGHPRVDVDAIATLR